MIAAVLQWADRTRLTGHLVIFTLMGVGRARAPVAARATKLCMNSLGYPQVLVNKPFAERG